MNHEHDTYYDKKSLTKILNTTQPKESFDLHFKWFWNATQLFNVSKSWKNPAH